VIAFLNCTESYRNIFWEIQQPYILYRANVLVRSRCEAVASRQLFKIFVLFVFVSENVFSSLTFTPDKTEHMGNISEIIIINWDINMLSMCPMLNSQVSRQCILGRKQVVKCSFVWSLILTVIKYLNQYS